MTDTPRPRALLLRTRAADPGSVVGSMHGGAVDAASRAGLRPVLLDAAGLSPEWAADLARAEAEQRVLQQRAENRQAELDADVKRVADAEKYRRQQIAEAEAFERRSKAEADAAVAEQEAQAVKVRAQAEDGQEGAR